MNRTFSKPARGLAFVLAATALVACSKPAPEKKAEAPSAPATETHFVGLHATPSDVTSPGGCAMSMLQSLALEWKPSDKGSGKPEDVKSATLKYELLTTPAVKDSSVVIYLRGALDGAGAAQNVLVSLGGTALTSPAPTKEDDSMNYVWQLEGKLPAGQTLIPLNVTLNLPRPAQDADPYENHFWFDSIDLAVKDPAGAGAHPCGGEVTQLRKPAAAKPAAAPGGN